jgi:hypothetical protein
MSSVSKNGGGKKRNDRPIQPINLSNVLMKKNESQQNLPAAPPAPSLSIQNLDVPRLPTIPSMARYDNNVAPAKVRSPHDNTQLVINGQVVKMDTAIDNRIFSNEEKIRPMTPPVNQYIKSPNMIESNLTPNRYIDSNIKILNTPPKAEIEEEQEETKVDSPMSEVSAVTENIIESRPVYNTAQQEFDNQSVRTAKTANRSLKSILPSFKPSDKPKTVFNRNEIHSDEDEDDEVGDKTKGGMSPVNIPYPVFDNNFGRTTSPIQTIGPKSPGVNVKPLFTETGKSSTPRPAARAMTPVKPTSVRAMTPPPAFRSPRKQPEEFIRGPEPSNNMNFYATPVMQPVYHQEQSIPMENHYDPYGVNSKITHRPNYAKITKDQEVYLRSEFKVKFGILRSTYPQWDVIEPNDTLTLEQIHDLYDHYLKQILISRETGNYKTYMVIFLMVIEVIGVKFLKLNMSGYTLSQLRIINRYDSLFMELGEKYLISSGSNWPVEVRIVMMMLFNAVIFLVVRYLCSWMGMEGIADTLQGLIDNMLNGPNMMTQNTGGPIGSSNAIPDPISSTEKPAATTESGGSNTIDKIADMFGSFVSKNGSNITEKIAEIGTLFTSKTQNSNNVNKQQNVKENKDKDKEREKRRKINKKKLFED